MTDSALRPVDRALDAWAAGDHPGALRWAVPLLEAQPDSALALLATAYLGAKEGDPKASIALENGENIQRSKLRVDTRLKVLGKWNPKRWGDKIELAGDKDAPLTIVVRKLTDA